MSESRKNDHINLTDKSVPQSKLDLLGSHYEPLFSGICEFNQEPQVNFGPYSLDLPIWISSMTGGAQRAKKINKNLARLCGEFKLGMGLGSCRSLLFSNDRIEDFDYKDLVGDQPLFTNFGIAQVEELVDDNKVSLINEVNVKLNADGIIIHINPLQEFMQPEGDRYKRPPLETIQKALDKLKYPVIVKEVGQGFGPRSLEALFNLPLLAIDLAGFGGTNFTKLEELRLGDEKKYKIRLNSSLYQVGHSCEEMIDFVLDLDKKLIKDKNIIISGGLKRPLDGVLLKNKLDSSEVQSSLIGFASLFLKHAQGEYSDLKAFMYEFKESYRIAKNLIERK